MAWPFSNIGVTAEITPTETETTSTPVLTPWMSAPAPTPAWRRRMIWLVQLIITQVGATELLVMLGLLCVARGCYLLAPAAGWIVPGAILLWWALPQRPRFIAAAPPKIVQVARAEAPGDLRTPRGNISGIS